MSHLTNDLLADPTPEARAHLDSCAECRERASTVVRLFDVLRRSEPVTADPALVARIVARLPRRHTTRRVRSSFAWVWAVAAAAAVLVAVGFIIVRPRATAVEQVAKDRPLPPPVERVKDLPPPPPAPRTETPPAPEPPPVEPKPTPQPDPKPEPPKPEPKPQPEPPRETKPEEPAIELASVEGPVETTDAKKWRGALRAKGAPARLTFADGTRLSLDVDTEVRVVGATTIALDRGAVYGESKNLTIQTDGETRANDAKFGVRRTSDHTEVVVLEGEVVVANAKGEQSVRGGHGASMARGAAPTKPRPVDAERAIAWSRKLNPPERAIWRIDFENVRKPANLEEGTVVAGPARFGSRFSLQASDSAAREYGPAVNFKVDDKLGDPARLKLLFRAHVAGRKLWINLHASPAGDNYTVDVPVREGEWTTVEVPLADLVRLVDRSRLRTGDKLNYLQIGVRQGGESYFDDIELLEVTEK